MNKIKKMIATLAFIGLFSAQSANAAWVVGVANIFAKDYTAFNEKVDDLTYKIGITSWVLGVVTGADVFHAIFLLDEDTNVADIQTKLLEESPFLKDHSEANLALAKEIMLKLENGELPKVDNSEDLELWKLSLEAEKVELILDKNGVDASSNDAKKLIQSLK